MADAQADVVELARIKYRCLTLLPLTSSLSIVTLALYLGLRLRYLIEAYCSTNNLSACLNSTIYFLAEIGLFSPNLLNHLLRCLAFGGNVDKEARHLRLLDGKDPPRVDVFITCAGEDIDTIVNTTEAACALDYPAHRFRVILLDDAGSKDLSRKIHQLGETRANLSYSARKKGRDHHFKAGNLNHACKHVESLPGGAADFIAALDADMIPDPKWLRALMPHMLRDQNMALVQPPQVSIQMFRLF